MLIKYLNITHFDNLRQSLTLRGLKKSALTSNLSSLLLFFSQPCCHLMKCVKSPTPVCSTSKCPLHPLNVLPATLNCGLQGFL